MFFSRYFECVLNLDGKQASQAGAVLGGGYFRFVKHFHGHRVSGVDERGEANQRLAAFADFQQLRSSPKVQAVKRPLE